MFGVHGMNVGVLLIPVSLCTFSHTYTVERPSYCVLLVVRSCGSRLRLSSVPGLLGCYLSSLGRPVTSSDRCISSNDGRANRNLYYRTDKLLLLYSPGMLQI